MTHTRPVRPRRRGFILIEAVLAIALVGLVVVAALRLARVLSDSADLRRDLTRSLALAETVEAEARILPTLAGPKEGSFDLHPDYSYVLLPGEDGAARSVVIQGPRGERIFPLAPEGTPLPLRTEEEARE